MTATSKPRRRSGWSTPDHRQELEHWTRETLRALCVEGVQAHAFASAAVTLLDQGATVVIHLETRAIKMQMRRHPSSRGAHITIRRNNRVVATRTLEPDAMEAIPA